MDALMSAETLKFRVRLGAAMPITADDGSDVGHCESQNIEAKRQSGRLHWLSRPVATRLTIRTGDSEVVWTVDQQGNAAHWESTLSVFGPDRVPLCVLENRTFYEDGIETARVTRRWVLGGHLCTVVALNGARL